MTGVHAPGVTRADELKRALGRVLLFIVLFLACLTLGTFIVPGATESSTWGLFAGSILTAVAAAAAGAFLIVRLDRRHAGALGVAWTSLTLRELGLGSLIGGSGILAAALLMIGTDSLRYGAQAGSLGAWGLEAGRALIVLAPAAAAEELLFRGYAFQWATRATGPVTATLLGSAAFAAAHLSNPDLGVLAVINLFGAGILLSVAYLKTRSLWFATAVHLGWNWTMAVPLDLPVSGLELFDAPMYEPVIAGAPVLTGGSFGPEGGLAATLAALVALLAIVKLPGVREAAEMRALSPLVDLDETGGK
jgi:membrane protease YdiL (CAAX protease family)